MPRPSAPPAPEPSALAPGLSVRRGLAHPLPAGMRDLLPGEASAHAELSRSLLSAFEIHGYELVTLPIFEYASVLEQGLGALGEDEVLRFVEPETGAVLALRPDVTPQVARLWATRLRDAPDPARLCYAGSVLRRRRERARQKRQIPQAGIELMGLPGCEGDLEVLSVASAAARRAGLHDFTLDLGHAGIAGALLEGVSQDPRQEIVEALGVRDAPEIARRAAQAGLDGRTGRALAELVELAGGDEVFARARRVLGGTAAEAPLAELEQLWREAGENGIAPKALVDFAETRDLAYYTGPVFRLYATGPGRAVGAGGRYDRLGARYGRSGPAAGFAFQLDELSLALDHAGRTPSLPPRVLVSGGGPAELSALRAARVLCAPAPLGDLLAYARAWRYTHIVEIALETATLVSVSDLSRLALPRDPRALGVATAALFEGRLDEG